MALIGFSSIADAYRSKSVADSPSALNVHQADEKEYNEYIGYAEVASYPGIASNAFESL